MVSRSPLLPSPLPPRRGLRPAAGTGPGDVDAAASRDLASPGESVLRGGPRSRRDPLSSLRGPRRRGAPRVIPIWARWRSTLSRRARGVGALLLILAAGGAILVPRGSPAPTGRLVVAERDLPVGHVLTAADLVLREASGPDLPRAEEAEALRSELLEAQLAVPVRRGEVLASGMASSGELVRELPEGMVAVSVRAREATSKELLGPGVRATLLASSPEGEVLEAEALILRGPDGASSGAEAGWGSASREGAAGPVLVGVGIEDARRLSAAEGGVGFAVHR
jgi:pilus assembly protein CpaB